MIGDHDVVALIPARGGSRGVPRKNLRRIGGRTLVARAVDAARGSRYVDRIVVSTDDDEIAVEAAEAGAEVPYVRDHSLAGDATGMAEVVEDAIRRLGLSGWVVLLQPTSPLREAGDIDSALNAARSASAESCVSLGPARSHPDWLWRLVDGGRMRRFGASGNATRRQDLEPLYERNGAIFAFTVEWFLRTREFSDESTVAYLMPEERSLDVDSELDLAVAEILLARREE